MNCRPANCLKTAGKANQKCAKNPPDASPENSETAYKSVSKEEEEEEDHTHTHKH